MLFEATTKPLKRLHLLPPICILERSDREAALRLFEEGATHCIRQDLVGCLHL
jgi:hypothetical protein